MRKICKLEKRVKEYKVLVILLLVKMKTEPDIISGRDVAPWWSSFFTYSGLWVRFQHPQSA